MLYLSNGLATNIAGHNVMEFFVPFGAQNLHLGDEEGVRRVLKMLCKWVIEIPVSRTRGIAVRSSCQRRPIFQTR